jgi:cellulose synthase/poly-beta-1,6-N-acetylglucosamine synthase-like glycosyltransferase
MIIKILFWGFLFIVFYTYLGYGILIWLLNRIKSYSGKAGIEAGSAHFEPSVALVIAAYNEEDYIEDKIKNTLSLHYPEDKLVVYFVTDGSNDNTPLIVKQYSRFTLLHLPERNGKAAAMNRAMGFIQEPYVIFCDANTILNKDCVKEIVKFYADPSVGAVAGEKKIYQPVNTRAASAGEGLYWKYESFLKKQDSDFYTVVGAAGELFSVRTALYQPIEEGVLIEDFVLSLRIAKKGYVVKYAPGAYAVEYSSASIKDEQKRKVRISAGGFQAMYMLRELLNIFKYGTLSFQYISHRVLRWSVTPVCLLLLLPLNIVLTVLGAGFIYDILLVMQLFFYLSGLLGWFFAHRNIKIKALYIPYYFLFMNVSVLWGFKRFLKGQQSVLWEKAAREKAV